RSLTPTKPALTVTADNQPRAYGDANPPFTATLSGFKNAETLATSGVTGTASCTSTATPASPVAGSPYPITCTAGTLTAGNYAFGSFVEGQLTITKAALTGTADNPTRAPLPTTTPSPSAPLSGFKNAETLATSGVTGTASCTSTATPASPVAGSPYPITCTAGTLTAGNYAFVSFVEGQLTITKAALTVTADNQTRAYGDANPTFTPTLSGFKNAETLATSGVTPTAHH